MPADVPWVNSEEQKPLVMLYTVLYPRSKRSYLGYKSIISGLFHLKLLGHL